MCLKVLTQEQIEQQKIYRLFLKQFEMEFPKDYKELTDWYNSQGYYVSRYINCPEIMRMQYNLLKGRKQ